MYENTDDGLLTLEEEKEIQKSNILENEEDILSAVLNAANAKDDEDNYEEIQIKRKGISCFKFRIRPITGDELKSCDKKAAIYDKKGGYGRGKVPIGRDDSKYNSYIIYTGTIDEDRSKIWNNRKIKESLHAMEVCDVIEKVLLAGEKTRIVDRILTISGYSDDDESGEESIEETVKN